MRARDWQPVTLETRRPPLAGESLERQFVIASLVYNSGILFSPERIDQILTFSTGEYLAQANVLNAGKRPPLPLYPLMEIKRRLIAGDGYPKQLTSWNAVYHILQRYGAWTSLRRFSSVFDQRGAFVARD